MKLKFFDNDFNELLELDLSQHDFDTLEHQMRFALERIKNRSKYDFRKRPKTTIDFLERFILTELIRKEIYQDNSSEITKIISELDKSFPALLIFKVKEVSDYYEKIF